MHGSKWSRWLVLLGVVVGCNAKLSVEPGTGGAGGMTALAGAAGSAGRLRAGAGGDDETAATAGSAGETRAGAGAASTAGTGGNDEGGGVAGTNVIGAGAGGQPPGPGELSQPCIPGETIDTGDGFAKAKITTLARCYAGLSCNSAGKCAAIPSCPKATGECIEYDTLSTGGNGAGGAPEVPAAGANFGGSGGNPDSSGPVLTQDESGVTALAIDDTHLYWLEYGTRDSIGNYQHDGALMAMTLADGTKTKLASAIAGPNAIGITDGQAYVLTDGAALVGTPAHFQLLRFPLTGGTSQLIQDGSPPLLSGRTTSFAAVGSTAYWTGPNSLYSLASGGTVPAVIAQGYVDKLHGDGANLYFDDGYGHISRTALAGGAIEPVGLDLRPFDLNSDSIYGLEYTQNGMILTKSAKSNAAWLRIRALGEEFPARLVFAGDRLFYEWRGNENLPGVTTATLSSTAPPIRLVDPNESFVKYWVGTSSKLYWTDGRRIYSRTIPTP